MSTRIIGLQIENFKRIHAVSITPSGNTIVLGGKNGAGKTSVLDAIMAALGGKSNTCSQPLRDGADHGEVVVELDDLVVTRTFTAGGGGTIKVVNAEGFKASSPQKVLDQLVGALSFDPLDFSRMKDAKQAETLKSLVGLDCTDLDGRRLALYDERKEVNRASKALSGHLAGLGFDAEAPETEVSTAELFEQLQAANKTNDANAAARQRVGDIGQAIISNRAELARVQRELEALKAKLADLTRKDDDLAAERVTAQASVAELEDIDLAPIEERIAGADDLNARVRQNASHRDTKTELEGSEQASRELTEKIARIDAEKAGLMKAADFPVDGLGFDEHGVTLNGLPFDQASSAEQLRVSVAMGAALNPELRVLLVRDGSLLDADSMATLAVMAEEHDLQVWLERVGDGDEIGVLIEDGKVAERRADAA